MASLGSCLTFEVVPQLPSLENGLRLVGRLQCGHDGYFHLKAWQCKRCLNSRSSRRAAMGQPLRPSLVHRCEVCEVSKPDCCAEEVTVGRPHRGEQMVDPRQDSLRLLSRAAGAAVEVHLTGQVGHAGVTYDLAHEPLCLVPCDHHACHAWAVVVSRRRTLAASRSQTWVAPMRHWQTSSSSRRISSARLTAGSPPHAAAYSVARPT